MELHYSQTGKVAGFAVCVVLLPYGITLLSNFDSLVEVYLHCFTTIWNYTTLKRQKGKIATLARFTTIWNYTTLKQCFYKLAISCCFTTIWNYTTLKQCVHLLSCFLRFTTIWNYTTLKPQFESK